MTETTLTENEWRMVASDVAQEIDAVLLEMFPDAGGPHRRQWADSMSESFSIATAIQVLERSDRDPQKDLESFAKAIKQLESALRTVEEIGHEGGWALLRTDPRERMPMGQASAEGAKTAFSDEIRKLLERLRAAEERVDPNAPSTEAIFDDSIVDRPKRTKPKETAAGLVALDCWDAFTSLSGRPATVPSKDGVAYGQFLEFVGSIFQALGIPASPETWARKSIRHRKQWPK